jgi:hypothetical protein
METASFNNVEFKAKFSYDKTMIVELSFSSQINSK